MIAHTRQRLSDGDPRDNPELNRTYLSLPQLPTAPPGLAQGVDTPALQYMPSTPPGGVALNREPSLNGSPHRDPDSPQ